MNEAVELHDSKLAQVSYAGGSVVLSLRPAYLHRSEGRPGCDPGTGWVRDATLTISGATISALVALPAAISEGSIRIDGDLQGGLCPAEGSFDGSVELALILVTSERLTVRGDGLTVTWQGDSIYVEDFTP